MPQVIPTLALGLESKRGTLSLGFRKKKKKVAKVSCKLWRGVRSFGRINLACAKSLGFLGITHPIATHPNLYVE
jgi:CRISPR/Cas system type I-B associated protein Csh2 (Cas7 group RAMP superfamily)